MPCLNSQCKVHAVHSPFIDLPLDDSDETKQLWVLILQLVKNYIKVTLTGPATALGEDTSPQEMRDSFVTVLVARHFEAMWVHMKQGLDALPAPHHRLMDQVSMLLCHVCARLTAQSG